MSTSWPPDCEYVALLGKKDFPGVNKLGSWDGKLSWITNWAQCNCEGPYKREAGQSELEKEAEMLCVWERFEGAALLAFNMKEGDTSPGMQWPPVAGKGKEQVVPTASRRTVALPTPWFQNFWFPER